MADRNDRNSKQAKRQTDKAVVDSHGKTRTYIHDPKHMAYDDRTMDVHHLTRNARICLGLEPDYSSLNS